VSDKVEVRCYVCGGEIEKGDHVEVTALRDEDPLAALSTFDLGGPEGSNGTPGVVVHQSCRGMMEGARLSVADERRFRRAFKGLRG
jgi:hypothetical protein